MFKEIPYFKGGKLKQIIPMEGKYFVYRYNGNGSKIVTTSCSINEYNKNMLQKEYLKTIEEYLDFNKRQYLLYKNKNVRPNKKFYTRNKLLKLLGILGIVAPFGGIIIKSSLLLYIGIGTLILGSCALVKSSNNLKKYNREKSFAKYIEQYEMLQFELSYNKAMKRKPVSKSSTIKPIINPVYDIDLKKVRKKN